MGHRLISTFLVPVLICGLSLGQSGSEVYGTRCATCHGVDGAGKTNAEKTFGGMPDLRKAVLGKTDNQLFDTVGRGTDHRQYAHFFLKTGLTQGQVADVVAHLKKLAKK